MSQAPTLANLNTAETALVGLPPASAVLLAKVALVLARQIDRDAGSDTVYEDLVLSVLTSSDPADLVP